ncbi:MAG: FkbM family methyltransferase [Pseudomonadota bacterium]
MFFASQAGQDRFVDERIFGGKRDGVFVEIGAYDGVTGSNSLFFERVRNWKGLLIEPVERLAQAARRARCVPCLTTAIGQRTGVARFLEIERGYKQMSGFLETYPADLLETVRAHPDHREGIVEVPVATLSEVLETAGHKKIDYLSLDVEGAEASILAGFDFDAFQIDCWSIENNGNDAAIRQTMERAGYRHVGRIGVDEMYVRKSFHLVEPQEPMPDDIQSLPSGTPDMVIEEIATPAGTLLYPAEETFIGQCLSACGTFCPQEADLYATIVEPQDTIIDAGAHVGWFTLHFAHLVGPSGRVIAFEPQRPLFDLLFANAARNGAAHVEPWHAALGEREGTAKVVDQRFDLPGNFGGAPLIEAGAGHPVRVVPLDALDLDRCNLIKADVQGMERDVLIGAAGTIERFRPVLYLENEVFDRSPQLISTLFALGYRAFWHCCPIVGPQAPDDLTARLCPNMLCVPEEREPPAIMLPEIRDRSDWWQTLR